MVGEGQVGLFFDMEGSMNGVCCCWRQVEKKCVPSEAWSGWAVSSKDYWLGLVGFGSRRQRVGSM